MAYGLFRQINNTIKSGAFAVNAVIKAKSRQGIYNIKAATSLAIFTTSALNLGASLLNKARKSVSGSGSSGRSYGSGNNNKNNNKKGNKKSSVDENNKIIAKKEAEKEMEDRNKKKKPTISQALYDKYYNEDGTKKSKYERDKEALDKLLIKQQEERDRNAPPKADLFQKIKPREPNNQLGIPNGFYTVMEDMKKEYERYMIVSDVSYIQGRVYIPLYGTYSKAFEELSTSGTMFGKVDFEYSPDERKMLNDKYGIKASKDVTKQTLIIVGANGIYNEKEENYFKLTKNKSELMSRLSVDYGKNNLPFLYALLEYRERLETEGFF